MKQFIILLILLIPLVIAEEAYVLDLSINKGVLSNSIKITDAEISPDKGDYYIEVYNFQNVSLFKQRFEESTGKAIVSIPYFKQGKEIAIGKDSEIIRIPVYHFAETCPSEVCESHESFETCPEDCEEIINIPIPEEVSEEVNSEVIPLVQESDTIIEQTPEQMEKSNSYFLFFIPVVFVIILLIASMLFIHSKKESRVLNYIKANKEKGYTNEEIKSVLLKKYSKKAVDKEFSKLEQEKSQDLPNKQRAQEYPPLQR